MVAAAIIGSAVIGGVTTSIGASGARSATRYGADRAAQAQFDAVQLQVAEAQRQFDTQLELLMPMLEAQYGAQEFFASVLGFGDFDPETGTFAGGGPGAMGFGAPGGFMDPNLDPRQFGTEDWRESAFGENVLETQLAGDTPEADLAIARARETGLYDELDDDTLMQQINESRLAGTPLEGDIYFDQVLNDRLARGEISEDEYRQQVQETMLTGPGGFAEDPRFQYAQETAVVGEDFRTSPGYQFQLEEMERATARQYSAGGGSAAGSGRVAQELQRRAGGIADQEYYNWVNARQGDLARQDVAVGAYQGREEFDRARMDRALEDRFGREQFDIAGRSRATENYLARRGVDAARGDRAASEFRGRQDRRQELDLARGDTALQDYFRRRAGDVGRQDQAILRNQDLGIGDRSRQDQSYYNYLNLLRGQATSGAVNQAVGASAREGAAVGGAYANQGNYLSDIWSRFGTDRANIAMGEAAGWNNALQSGMGNWLYGEDIGLFD